MMTLRSIRLRDPMDADLGREGKRGSGDFALLFLLKGRLICFGIGVLCSRPLSRKRDEGVLMEGSPRCFHLFVWMDALPVPGRAIYYSVNIIFLNIIIPST
jgi:hypothetical protein